jgi:ATP-binding cassette subfamily F protein 3
MPDAKPAAVRAQLGRFGFAGDRAIQKVGSLSGGERARLALALITRNAPHLLILDEPTNHLDVDSREALVQALNNYSGAVVIVSHDRHMIELVADRLVLVDGGRAQDYAGSLEDYTDFILGRRGSAEGPGGGKPSKADKRASAQAREQAQALRKRVKEAEGEIARLARQRDALDLAMFDPAKAEAALRALTMTELMRRRAAVVDQLDAAEAAWLAASEAIETNGA